MSVENECKRFAVSVQLSSPRRGASSSIEVSQEHNLETSSSQPITPSKPKPTATPPPAARRERPACPTPEHPGIFEGLAPREIRSIATSNQSSSNESAIYLPCMPKSTYSPCSFLWMRGECFCVFVRQDYLRQHKVHSAVRALWSLLPLLSNANNLYANVPF